VAGIAIGIAGRNIGKHMHADADVWPDRSPPATRLFPAAGPPLDDFHPDQVRSALQGTWRYEDARIAIDGNHIRVDHGAVGEGGAHFAGQLTVTSPCGLHVRLDGGGERSMSFSLASDGPRFAIANGVRRGDGYLFCIGESVFARDEHGCGIWDRRGNAWVWIGDECSLTFDGKDGGRIQSATGIRGDLAIRGAAITYGADDTGPAMRADSALPP
jgi:hypothetical protein